MIVDSNQYSNLVLVSRVFPLLTRSIQKCREKTFHEYIATTPAKVPVDASRVMVPIMEFQGSLDKDNVRYFSHCGLLDDYNHDDHRMIIITNLLLILTSKRTSNIRLAINLSHITNIKQSYTRIRRWDGVFSVVEITFDELSIGRGKVDHVSNKIVLRNVSTQFWRLAKSLDISIRDALVRSGYQKSISINKQPNHQIPKFIEKTLSLYEHESNPSAYGIMNIPKINHIFNTHTKLMKLIYRSADTHVKKSFWKNSDGYCVLVNSIHRDFLKLGEFKRNIRILVKGVLDKYKRNEKREGLIEELNGILEYCDGNVESKKQGDLIEFRRELIFFFEKECLEHFGTVSSVIRSVSLLSCMISDTINIENRNKVLADRSLLLNITKLLISGCYLELPLGTCGIDYDKEFENLPSIIFFAQDLENCMKKIQIPIVNAMERIRIKCALIILDFADTITFEDNNKEFKNVFDKLLSDRHFVSPQGLLGAAVACLTTTLVLPCTPTNKEPTADILDSDGSEDAKMKARLVTKVFCAARLISYFLHIDAMSVPSGKSVIVRQEDGIPLGISYYHLKLFKKYYEEEFKYALSNPSVNEILYAYHRNVPEEYRHGMQQLYIRTGKLLDFLRSC